MNLMNNKMKHTPVPWYPVQYACFWNIQDEPVYGKRDLLDERTCEEAAVNAKLMAAAPELLKVLQAFVDLYGTEESNPNEMFDAYWNAKEIIKKTTE